MALEHLPAPRKERVRVSDPDISALKEKHGLTIIGRVTNPSVQKVWSLILFFTEHWKADIPPVGSDLGLGMFQFHFELESDLMTVLEKQPYHYARWMIILQRWEPIVSPDFPSMIPFWIKVQGIPIHLWREETIRSIGEDIGTYEKAEITSTSIRMKVHINGRLPLIKSSIIEYPNGDEVMATLVYERLEKHCSKCNKLDHELRDCLLAKAQRRALITDQNEERKTGDSMITAPPAKRADSLIESRRREPLRRVDRDQGRRYPSHSHGPSLSRSNQLDQYHRRRLSKAQEWRPRDHTSRGPYEEVSQGNSASFRGDSHSHSSPKERHNIEQNQADDLFTPQNHHYSPREIGSDTRNKVHPSVRGTPLRRSISTLPQEAVNAAIGEIREAMTQYTNCADPSESAARKERMRQAGAQGDFEESAVQIVKANLARASEETVPITSDPISQERLPISARMGPTNRVSDPTERTPIFARLGPVNDDQMELEKVCNLEVGEQSDRVPLAARLGPVNTDTAMVIAQPEKEPSMPIKRKPGRPPGKQRVTPSLLPAPESSSRKRKAPHDKPPSGRTKPATETVRPRRVVRVTKNRRRTPRSTRRPATPTSSENLPIAHIIPPAARRRMDFRVPSNPVP